MDYLVSQLLTPYDDGSSPGLLGFLHADFLGTVKTVLQILSVIFILANVFVIVKFSKLRPHAGAGQHLAESLRGSLVSPTRLARQWDRITQRLQHPNEAEWKIAVIEADNLVDDLLRRMGYSGTTMGERLKSINPNQIATLDALWQGHKFRNRIVHDPEGRILHKEAREAIANFEAFLHEVRVFEKTPEGRPAQTY